MATGLPARQTRWSYSNGEGTTHSENCWEYHIHCALHIARELLTDVLEESSIPFVLGTKWVESTNKFLEGTNS